LRVNRENITSSFKFVSPGLKKRCIKTRFNALYKKTRLNALANPFLTRLFCVQNAK